MLLGKKKDTPGIIVGMMSEEKKPDSGADEEDARMTAMKSAASDLIEAVHAKDEEGVVAALSNFHTLCADDESDDEDDMEEGEDEAMNKDY